eukprot:CCRYP_009092-RA/>CCRYP_009092-RA protein AED:0.09 eAED:0.09 QI:75/0.5/1/1/0.5/0.33/3/209/498
MIGGIPRARTATRILSFVAVFVYCIRNEISIVNTANDPNAIKKPHRKWKHVRTVTDESTSTRVTFQLHAPTKRPIKHVFNLYMRCALGNLSTGEVRSGELPSELVRVEAGRVLDFTTTISTSLKFLSIGDSVTIQLSESLDEIVGGDELKSRSILWEAWNGHDGGTIVWPTYGGGAAATWRMTGLLSRKREGKPPANSPGGGWNTNFTKQFLNHTMVGSEVLEPQEQQQLMPINPQQEHQPINSSDYSKTPRNNATVGHFDVVVLRVMHGWMQTYEITPQRLLEAVRLASELFGAETVILQTIPFTNNVKTPKDMNEVNKVNDEIRKIAHECAPCNSTLPLKNVLVQEYGQYYNHIIWSNARYLGYGTSHPLDTDPRIFESEGPSFLYDRLNDGKKWPPSIPMVCSDLDSLGKNRDKCNRNYLFRDGMHVCPETITSRYAASLACLMGCVYNGDNERSKVGLRSCERECNQLFMSVVPVEDSWVDVLSALRKNRHHTS